ncbi:MAG TPA: Bax inhibitor-1/YccA family protein, partial [Nitrospirota bacterium]|nr:Bax inhibitor-1/YccA family protein [Nitrospirota bacterium]
MMRTANPALNDDTFKNYGRAIASGDTMTIQGTVNKSAVLLLLVLLTSAWTWRLYYTAAGSLGVWIFGGAIGGFIVAMVTVFKKQWAAMTAPLYALLEGLVLGGISSMLEARYPGIVIQAVGLTFGTLFGLLFAYKSGMIKATENFKLGVVAATGGIAVVYLVTMLLGFFGIRMPYIH